MGLLGVPPRSAHPLHSFPADGRRPRAKGSFSKVNTLKKIGGGADRLNVWKESVRLLDGTGTGISGVWLG